MFFTEPVMIPFFDAEDASLESIKQAGVEAMKITYGIGCTKTLEVERHIRFLEQANRGKIDPNRLQPTEDACSQHALSVQNQFITWKHMDTEMLSDAGRV